MWLLMLKTLLTGVIGGIIFQSVQIPLPWLLGPLTAALIADSASAIKAFWPAALRNAALVPLGYMMGVPFTVETGLQIVRQLPSMLFVTASTVLFSLFLAWLTTRQAGISLPTSVVGSIPGGLTQMAVLAEELKSTDATTVIFMQTLRMLSVVFIIPFLAIHGVGGQASAATAVTLANQSSGEYLANPVSLIFIAVAALGALGAERLHFPTPHLLGPMLVIIILILAGFAPPRLPAAVITAAQLAVGIYMGASVKLQNIANWKKLLPYSCIGAAGIVLFSLILGFFLTCLYPLKLTTAFLCTAPGGVTEMGITAMMIQADISVVTAYQMFRVLFILLIVPQFLRWWFKRPVET